MATFTETGVDVTVELQRSAGVDHILITSQSQTATGEQIRSVHELDVSLLVNASIMADVTSILNRAESYMKNMWNIP